MQGVAITWHRAILAGASIALCAFALGWFVKGNTDSGVLAPQSLRLGGYQFINPLLVCNINNSNIYSQNTLLTKELQSIIDANKTNGAISKASVYFTDLKTGAWANVFGAEQFYPSSLGKIPIMIAYYQEAESNPNTLEKELVYPAGATDLNAMQDIKPQQAIVPGHTYTAEQLIEYMIKYSDNNATALLDSAINPDTLNRVYGDLGIPSVSNVNAANADFITAHQVSTMFRVLYNGTYLSRNYSEQALKLLSQASFVQGLVAGVASSTVVAHKLGLVGIGDGAVSPEHELHDCGIVYGKDPYLMCVMTRGTAPLTQLESIIAQLSKSTYSSVQSAQ